MPTAACIVVLILLATFIGGCDGSDETGRRDADNVWTPAWLEDEEWLDGLREVRAQKEALDVPGNANRYVLPVSWTATPAALPSVRPLAEGVVGNVSLTFYVCRGAPPGFEDGFCGTQADGSQVYEGGAACGYGWSLGTRFRILDDPTGRIRTCSDRGLGPWHWLDVFFWEYEDGRAWRDTMPRFVTVEVIE